MAAAGTARSSNATAIASGWVRRHSSSRHIAERDERGRPARPGDAGGEQRLRHRQDEDRSGQRDVERARAHHAARSSGSRARTA